MDPTLKKLIVQHNTMIRALNEAALQKRNAHVSKLLSWKIPKDSNSIFIIHWPYFKGLLKREEGIGKTINLLMNPWRFLTLGYIQTFTNTILSTNNISNQGLKPDCLESNLGSNSSYFSVPQLPHLSSRNKIEQPHRFVVKSKLIQAKCLGWCLAF